MNSRYLHLCKIAIAISAVLVCLQTTAKADVTIDDFNSGCLTGWTAGNNSDTTFAVSAVTSPARAGYSMRYQASLPSSSSWTSAEKALNPAQDWSSLAGIKVWIYVESANSATAVALQVWESGGERWEKKIVTNWTGWQQVTVPFSQFLKAWSPSTAIINNTFDKTSIGTVALAESAAIGSSVLYFDDLMLYSDTTSNIPASAGVIIPLYVYPSLSGGVHSWQPLIDAKTNNPTVTVWAVVNPNSGPGTALDSSYTDGISRLRAAGIKTLGYVHTSYGARSIATVEAEIDAWKNFYATDGIFFDEMAYQTNTYVQYYRDLNSYTKGRGFTITVGNPGTDTTVDYVGTVDTIIIYESAGFPSSTRYAGWHASYSKTNWGIIPYGVASLNSAQISDAKNYVKYIYVTNDNLPNPWDSIATYLNQLFTLLR